MKLTGTEYDNYVLPHTLAKVVSIRFYDNVYVPGGPVPGHKR